MASNSEKSPVMDVTRPGKTPAAATSRPVIIGHGAMMKDPMVRDNSREDNAGGTMASPAHDQPLVQKAELTVAPPESKEPVESSTADATVKTEPVTTESDAAAVPESTDDEAGESSQEESSEQTTESDEQLTEKGVVDAVVGQAAQNSKDKKKTEAEAAKQAAIEKLIKEKTYFVRIGQAHRAHKGGHGALVVLLILLVAAVAAYALADLGIISIGIDVPVHILGK